MIMALALMVVGCICVFDGMASRSENIWQQVAARIEWIGGFCMIGIGLIPLMILVCSPSAEPSKPPA